MMKTTPRLATDVCALDDTHNLPAMVTLYANEQEIFWVGREAARVVCSEHEADALTDTLASNG